MSWTVVFKSTLESRADVVGKSFSLCHFSFTSFFPYCSYLYYALFKEEISCGAKSLTFGTSVIQGQLK